MSLDLHFSFLFIGETLFRPTILICCLIVVVFFCITSLDMCSEMC